MTFVVGETIGPYQLVEQLGQGGMATVFKAYHAALDRYVAIKVLHPAFLEDANFLARFQREARLVARLEHPNIVPIYDFSDHEGRPYLVMKFIQGKTLKAYMSERLLPVGEVLRIVEAVGAALAYAHQQDILHRDIKPSNVLLTPEGQIYLADFGLARMASGSTSTLTSDMMVGTPQYISPEQAMSKPNIDGRTDIYSFGVMLYEMVVGRVPFSADTPFAVIHDHIYTPLPMPRKINPQVPESVERVLLKALAKDPDSRFSTTAEMVQAFKAAVGGLDPKLVLPRSDLPPVSEWVASDRIKSSALQDLPAPEPQESGSKPSFQPQNKPQTQSMNAPVPAQPAAARVSAVMSAQSSASTPMASLPKEQKKPWLTPGRIGCCVGIGLGMVVIAVAAVFFLRQWQQPVIRATPTGPEVGNLVESPAASSTAVSGVEVTPDTQEPASQFSEPVQVLLDFGLEAWQDGNVESTRKTMEALLRETEDQPETVIAVVNYLEAQGAWLPVAIYEMLHYVKHPTAFTGERQERLRMALYYAAEDELAGTFLEKNQENQLLLAANLRYALYFGDDFDGAKAKVNDLINDGNFARRFPEIFLLDAEYALEEEDSQRAHQRLNQVLERRDAPPWIKAVADELKSEIP